ncbi:Flp family type IVb pilin [Marinomonas algicola]|uniref:Flp family type IVb pilin n=1 Tax=Marinomonas algicola TaxID=2773454 RepID=UPI00174A0E72
MKNKLASFIENNQGITAIEYAIVGVGIATIVAAVMSNPALENALKDSMSKISTIISSL